MKIGICCSPDMIGRAAAAGAEYIEPAMAAMRGKTDAELLEYRKKAEEAGIPIDGFNCFFGGGISLYNDPEEVVRGYIERNCEIGRILGGKYCVVGSGGLRRIPDGADRKACEAKFVEIADCIGNVAAGYGLEIYLEPLSRAETNLMNTVREGLAFAEAVGNPNVGIVVDFFHFFVNGEPISDLDQLRQGQPGHVHIARPDPDRRAPTAKDVDAMKVWSEKLKKAGYDGRISLECTWGKDPAAEWMESVPLVRKVFS